MRTAISSLLSGVIFAGLSLAAEPLKAPAGAEVETLQAMTVVDFVNSFKPAPGTYEVVLIHPRTCCPQKVCFTLPNCCLKRVRLSRKEMAFDYGRVEVEIHFKKDGRLVVDYDD